MLNVPQMFAAVVLAAGQSRRFSCGNKLLARLDGKPLICHCMETLSRLGLSEIVVVTGFEADRIEEVLSTYDVHVVKNQQFEYGMGTSLAAGVVGLSEDVGATFICLADMPAIETDVFEALTEAFLDRPKRDICVPVFKRQNGHPVLFGRRHFSRLRALKGKQGARRVVAENRQFAQYVTIGTSSIVLDCDTEKDFRTVFAD